MSNNLSWVVAIATQISPKQLSQWLIVVTSSALMASSIICPAWPHDESPILREGQSPQCLLEVEGKDYIDGPCMVHATAEGIRITSLQLPYFYATVRYDAIKVKNPYYPTSVHDPAYQYSFGDSAEWGDAVNLHNLLGAVIQSGSCFTNDADGAAAEFIDILNNNGIEDGSIKFPHAKICVYLVPESTSSHSELVRSNTSEIASKIPRSNSAQFSFKQFKVNSTYRGATRFPNFYGRDRRFKDYRTRIRNGLKNGPNFAGHYSVIQFGCGTSCTEVYLADNRTGRVFAFPRGGEDNMSLDLAYELDSRLLAAQWQDGTTCELEYFEWRGDEARLLEREDLGPADICWSRHASDAINSGQ